MYQRSFEDLKRDVSLIIWSLQHEGHTPGLAEAHSLYSGALEALYKMPGSQECASVWVKTAILYGLACVDGKKPDWNKLVLRVTVEPAGFEIFQPISRHAQRFYALLITNVSIASCQCTFDEYRQYAGLLGERALTLFAAIGNPITLRRWRAAALLAQAYSAYYEEQDDAARHFAEQALPLVPSSAGNLSSIAESFLKESSRYRRKCWSWHKLPAFTTSDLYRFQES